ncbi:hypothetical protein [Fibrobacter sp.]|uniref:hypothetical protein n=1 Tax=Fibrobacter sp. TaxID=35828 RepID=UPI00389075F8
MKFSRSIFKGVIDSVPGEYYYYATDGRIDTLFKREDGQNKPVVSIAYDSPDGQSNFELEGVLEAEYEFPRYVKTYWNTGNPKDILTGMMTEKSRPKSPELLSKKITPLGYVA